MKIVIFQLDERSLKLAEETASAFPKGFRRVATVEADSLEVAWKITQEKNWLNHSEVSIQLQEKALIRISHVGDVFKLDGVLYEAWPFGFREVKLEPQAQLELAL